MAAFENIRKSIGSSILEKKRKRTVRHRAVQNFKTAKKTAILFDATDSESFRHIKDFRKFLEESGIKTELLGYVNGDDVPNDLLLWDNCRVLCRKDVDYFFRPRKDAAEEFIANDFDILFDLSIHNHFTLDYITRLSQAKFKTGRYTERENDYDLMINTGDNSDVNFLIEQMKNYISVLNNTKTESKK